MFCSKTFLGLIYEMEEKSSLELVLWSAGCGQCLLGSIDPLRRTDISLRGPLNSLKI